MKKFHILYFFLLIGINITSAQTLKPIARLIENTKMLQKDFKDVQDIIQITTNRKSLTEIRDASKVSFFDYNAEYFLREIVQNGASSISLSVSLGSTKSYLLDLVEVPATFYDYEVRTSSGVTRASNSSAKHYRGIVRGMETESLASISFFDNQMMGVVSIKGVGNITIGKLKNSSLHVMYTDDNLNSLPNYECDTPDDQEGLPYKAEHLFQSNANRSAVNCIKFYFETEADMFTVLGSVTNVENYVIGVFNNVATLYQNDGVTTEISEINIWNTADPYTADNTGTLLSQFQANTGAFNGDLGQLLTFRNVGGGRAAGFAGLCNPNSDLSLSVSSGLEISYPEVPAYSYTVEVVTHEFGHLFGSRHTHACVWNGNNTAIDGCPDFTEGSCPIPVPPIPTGGGTIMSYCHVQNVGINFNFGFGQQPGNLIRNNVENAGCLDACCPFIEMVRLYDDSYQNQTGTSEDNYSNYTDNCIPIFDTESPFLSITFSQENVFIAVYVDFDGDNKFIGANEELYNSFTGNNNSIGVNLGIFLGTLISGGEKIRIIVSDNQITDSEEVPICGEMEDYMLCIPPEECTLEALTSVGMCSDNGTPLDPTDDFYNITLDVFNTGGEPWTVVDSNGLTIYFGNGDENNVDLGNYLVLNGSEGFQIRYGDDCFLDFAVAAPTSCNFSCNISAVVSDGECNDNGTPEDLSDDTYTIIVSVLGTNGISWDLIGYAGNQPISYSGTGNTTNIELGPMSVGAGPWVMYISPTDLSDPGCRRYETTIFPPKCSDGEERMDKVSISPNPNIGRMNIKIETSTDIQNITLKIYDLGGLLIDKMEGLRAHNGTLEHNVDLSSQLRQGVYFFIFNIGGETIAKQVIVK